MSQYIDKESVYNHFPSGVTVPPRFVEFLDCLDRIIYDAGWFPEFFGESFDRYGSTCDGYTSDMGLSQCFGIFVGLGDGSLLAYWFYEGCDMSNPPIVILGSEGGLGIVAESIEELVARLIDNQFPNKSWIYPISNFYYYPDETWIDKLQVWAEETWSLTTERRKLLTASEAETRHPNLEEWLDDKLAGDFS